MVDASLDVLLRKQQSWRFGVGKSALAGIEEFLGIQI